MKIKKNFSLKERLLSFRHAARGLGIVAASQHNARIHLTAMGAALMLSYWLQIGRIKFCIIILAIVMVFAAEALNTTCEILVNMISPRYSARAGRAKDVSAGAVLVTSIGALVVGLIIFGPPLLQNFQSWTSHGS